ncbi:alpha,alpha-trehalose-phosphate synthase [Micromonospora sp. ATCC 39149]|nr:alpha,alpha-trehalose-phosphate synthase [Micromonospora sp. ATCC 39149]
MLITTLRDAGAGSVGRSPPPAGSRPQRSPPPAGGRPQRTPSSILTGMPGYAHITPPTEHTNRREPPGEILPNQWPIIDLRAGRQR